MFGGIEKNIKNPKKIIKILVIVTIKEK